MFENVLIGCHMRSQVGPFSALLGTSRSAERASEVRAAEILAFMGLGDRRDDETVNLPHGHQRALGIAVALAAEPKLMLLDEPFTGMNPEETRRMMALVERVRSEGVTILLVEHDMQAVMGLCERITVLSFGELLAQGNARRDPRRPGGHRGLSGKRLNAVPDQVAHRPLQQGDGAARGLDGGRRDRHRHPDRGQRARARARRCARSPAWSGPAPARSGSTARAFDTLAPDEVVKRGIAHVPRGAGTSSPSSRSTRT